MEIGKKHLGKILALCIKTVLSITFTLNVLVLYSQTESLDLCVEIEGLYSKEGNIILDIYQDKKSFIKEQPLFRFHFNKENMLHGIMKCILKLEPGSYAIAMIDDENSDGKLKRNILGYPLEGFGFSNLTMGRLRRPDFEEFYFNLIEENDRIVIKARYSRFHHKK